MNSEPDYDDEIKGLSEAIDNAVEYFREKGLPATKTLDVLSNARQRWKERLISEQLSSAVDQLLDNIFQDGRGTE